MPGRKKLRRVQFGREVTPGTAVAATAIWRGTGLLEDAREVEEVEEEVGILGGTDRTNIPMLLGKLKLDPIAATFEQLQYLYALGLGGPTTGSADGVGSNRIYTTPVPTTSAPACVPYTFQGGDDFEVEQLEYAHATKIELSGTTGKAVMMSAELQGRQVQRLNTGFTGGVALPAIDDILTSLGKVFLDPISGAYGATQVSAAILGFKLTIECKWVPKWFVDGQLTFTLPVLTDVIINGDLTFEHDPAVSGSNGEKANWRNQVPRLLQLRFEGKNVTTPGTTYSKKTAIVNLPIKWKKFAPLTDKDGNDTCVGSFVSKYNATAANRGQFIVVNELAALP